MRSVREGLADEAPGSLALDFAPEHFFAFGSPVGFFLGMRGQAVGTEWTLPSCPHLYNIFHPADPVAHRIEPLIELSLASEPPARVPTVDGRRPAHLALKDAMAEVSSAVGSASASMKRSLDHVAASPVPHW